MIDVEPLIKKVQQRKSYAKKEAERKLAVDIQESAALRGKVQAYEFFVEELNLLNDPQHIRDYPPQLNKGCVLNCKAFLWEMVKKVNEANASEKDKVIKKKRSKQIDELVSVMSFIEELQAL